MDALQGDKTEGKPYFTQTCLSQIREGVRSGILVGLQQEESVAHPIR